MTSQSSTRALGHAREEVCYSLAPLSRVLPHRMHTTETQVPRGERDHCWNCCLLPSCSHAMRTLLLPLSVTAACEQARYILYHQHTDFPFSCSKDLRDPFLYTYLRNFSCSRSLPCQKPMLQCRVMLQMQSRDGWSSSFTAWPLPTASINSISQRKTLLGKT